MTSTRVVVPLNAARPVDVPSVRRSIETILLASDLGSASAEATDVAIELAARCVRGC